MLIIHSDHETHPQPGGAGWDELMGGYGAFTESLTKKNIEFSGDPLQPPMTATTVRTKGGKTIITDGPFAETKEWMSGYFLVDCATLADAQQIAAQVPSAAFGSVEVRPIMDMH